jgi:predicted outer membrane repeat protein
MKAVSLIVFLVLLLTGVRCEAATVTLCNAPDENGVGINLRQAVAQGGIISFQCPAGTIIRVFFPLKYTRDTEIDGQNKITLSGYGRFSIFETDNAASISLRNLRLTEEASRHSPDGRQLDRYARVGSAVKSNGLVSLYGSEVHNMYQPFAAANFNAHENNRFYKNNGPIVLADKVTLQDCHFIDNSGEPFSNLGSANLGEAAFVERSEFVRNLSVKWLGSLSVSESKFEQNKDSESGGGAISIGGDFDANEVTFFANSGVNGGAISAWGGTKFKARSLFFDRNSASESGGAIYFSHASPIDGRMPRQTLAETYDISFSKFLGNQAPNGSDGAISLNGFADVISIRTSLFRGNVANSGSSAVGCHNFCNISINRSVVLENKTLNGGPAIDLLDVSYSTHSVLNLVNSIVARNDSPNGGGISFRTGNILNSTIYGNVGYGVRVYDDSTDPTRTKVSVVNSIVSANVSPGNGVANCLFYVASGFTEATANIEYPGTSCGAGFSAGDPQLDGYLATQISSPARGAGDRKRCHDQPVNARDLYNDLRGTAGGCTIGAIEKNLTRQIIEQLAVSEDPPHTTDDKLTSFWKMLTAWRNPSESTPCPIGRDC